MGRVDKNTNNIIFEGDFEESDLGFALAAFHNLTSKRGYLSIVLDFSKTVKAFAPDILPFCIYIRDQLHRGIDTTLILPSDAKTSRLFKNANWANLMDPRQFPKSDVTTHLHLPAQLYKTGEGQHKAVDDTIQILLSSMKNLTRNQLAALEWAVNEITDNVLNHAESSVGGVMQVTARSKGQIVEFVVCDAGVSIPKTLRNAHTDITS
ncbi:MAG: hypothetical protein L3J15_03265, partial [Devosiaceae bacterium]|nr:hypothetical protein [Devosiaceae bacterium]